MKKTAKKCCTVASKPKNPIMVVAGYKAHMSRELKNVKGQKKVESIKNKWQTKIDEYLTSQNKSVCDCSKQNEHLLKSLNGDFDYIVLAVNRVTKEVSLVPTVAVSFVMD